MHADKLMLWCDMSVFFLHQKYVHNYNIDNNTSNVYSKCMTKTVSTQSLH